MSNGIKKAPTDKVLGWAMQGTKRRRSVAGLSLTLLAGASGCGPEGSTNEGTEAPDIRQLVQPLGADVRNVLVSHEPGMFAGWPANHGIWAWGNEILVGFERDHYTPDPPGEGLHHNVGDDLHVYLARSMDGGEHWMIDDHPELEIKLSHDAEPPEDDKPPLDWAHPHFAMRLWANGYWLSQERGHVWKGPYAVPDFGHDYLSGRTAMVHTQGKTFFFTSVADDPLTQFVSGNIQANDHDNVARTMVFSKDDNDETFHDVAWVAPRPGPNCSTPPAPPCPPKFNYSLMPSPVVLDNGNIVVALRERGVASQIKVRASSNQGATWTDRSIPVAGNPDNPGSLVKLNDGRLALVYAQRNNPQDNLSSRVWARISTTGGTSWGDPIALTEAAWNSDMGYVQAVTRPDGRVVVVYYFTTNELQEQHIRATIWTPEGLVVKPISNLSESLILSAL